MKRKRVLSLILVICITICVAQIGFYKLAAEDTTKTVYVSQSGADSARNGTNAKPYKTIAFAISKAKSGNPDIIDIKVKDYAEFDFESEFNGKLVIEGTTDNVELQVVSNRTLEAKNTKTCILKSDITFKNIKILSALDGAGSPLKYSIITGGKTLLFDEGTSFDQNSFGILAGRANEYTTETFDQSVTVNVAQLSGEVNLSSGLDISLGVLPEKNSTDCKNALGKIDIDIKSGDIKKVSFLDTATVYGDDVTISWFADKKSEEQELIAFEGENNSTFKKSLQIIFNNGAKAENIAESVRNASADGGKWIILGDKEYCYLEATDVPGKYRVIGELNVQATNTQNSNEVYYSEESAEDGEKYLDISDKPGEYVISAIITPEFSETVYVSSSGDDNTGKGTQLKPFATIAKAEQVIESADIEAGEIVLLTNMTFTSAPHTKMITIRGNTGSENLTQPHSTISVGGPTTFKDFNINGNVSHISNGNDVIYDNITISGSYGTIYFGNLDSSVTTDNNITINGLGQSSWHGANVRIGPGTRQGTVNSNLNIVVNNGFFNQFWVFEGTYNGNVNITLNGGTVYGSDPFLDPYLDYPTVYNGAYQLILNSGFSPSKVSSNAREINAAKGSWFMYADKSGGMLSATETPGTFDVSNGKTAVAKERTSRITYYSHDNKLIVPEGTYDVTYTDDQPSDNMLVLSHKGENAARFLQKVSLTKGKKYNVSFDYIDGSDQLDKGIVLGVFDEQGNKVCSADNGGISLTSEDENYFHRTYSFNFNGSSGDYYIGFFISGDHSFAVTNIDVSASDNAGKNLIKNGDFKDHLNNWTVDGASSQDEDIKTIVGDDSKTTAMVQYYSGKNEYFDKASNEPVEELGTEKMLYVENFSGYRTFLQRFYKIIKPDTKYAFECSISSAIDYKLQVRKSGDRVAIYKLDPENVVDVEAETELGTVNYRHAYYEFEIPDTVDNQIFIGFEFSSGQTATIFDLKLYEVDDPDKTNLFVNPDFSQGLDEWIWGWTIWFNHATDSTGLVKWEGDTGKLILKKYDYKNLVTYFDDRYFIDGKWWDDKDVGEPASETASVSGTLKDSNGRALSNVELAFSSDDYEVKGQTDSNGNFNFDSIPAGKYDISVYDSTGEDYYVSYVVLIDGGKYNLDIVCDISNVSLDMLYDSEDIEENGVIHYGKIKGTVYTPDRKIIPGLTVYLNNGQSVVTDENGNFEFDSLAGAEYKIYTKVKGGYYVLKTVNLQENTVVTLKLKYSYNYKPKTEVIDEGLPAWVWILISASGAVVLLAGAFTAFFIIRKRKKLKLNKVK